jgi:hypothetical protein
MEDPIGYGSTWPGLYLYLPNLQDLNHLAYGPPDPCPWAKWAKSWPDNVSSPQVLGKQALILVNQIFLLVVKLSSAPSDLE